MKIKSNINFDKFPYKECHIIYLFTGYVEDKKFIVPPTQQLFHVAKPRKLVDAEVDNKLAIVREVSKSAFLF